MSETLNGKRPWEFACGWYTPAEIASSIAREGHGFGENKIPTDVYSQEFADWITEQYRLAMAKGIDIGLRSTEADQVAQLTATLAERDAEIERLRDLLGELAAEVCREESYGVWGSEFRICLLCNCGTEPGNAGVAVEHDPFCLIPKIEAALAALTPQEPSDGK